MWQWQILDLIQLDWLYFTKIFSFVYSQLVLSLQRIHLLHLKYYMDHLASPFLLKLHIKCPNYVA